MRKILTPQQEKFSRLLAEGKTQVDAAREAGYMAGTKSLNAFKVGAHNLSKHPNVKARVLELQHEAAYSVGVTLAKLAMELDDAFAKALEKGFPDAMIAATMAKAKLYGLIPQDKPTATVDLTILNKPMWTPGPLTEMSVEEWVAEYSPKEITHTNGHS